MLIIETGEIVLGVKKKVVLYQPIQTYLTLYPFPHPLSSPLSLNFLFLVHTPLCFFSIYLLSYSSVVCHEPFFYLLGNLNNFAKLVSRILENLFLNVHLGIGKTTKCTIEYKFLKDFGNKFLNVYLSWHMNHDCHTKPELTHSKSCYHVFLETSF